MRRTARLLSVALPAAVAIAACAGKTTPAGGLEVIIATSGLKAGTDFDTLLVTVQQRSASTGAWVQLFSVPHRVPGEITLPTTVSIQAGTSADQDALITVTALADGVALVQRIVQIQIPTTRVAELPMILAEDCVGKVTTCSNGSCQPQTGACAPNVVDPATLPTYQAGDEATIDAGTEEAGGQVVLQDASEAASEVDATTPTGDDAGPNAPDATLDAMDETKDATSSVFDAPHDAPADAPAESGGPCAGGGCVEAGAPKDAAADAPVDAAVEAGSGCTALTHPVLGTHIKLAVSWSSDTVQLASSGTPVVDIWLLSSLSVSGTALTGTSKTCGITLPPVQLSAVDANERIQLQFPSALWDASSMPTFAVSGTLSGSGVGSTLSLSPASAVLGLSSTSTYTNPATTWPPPSLANDTAGTFPEFAAADLLDSDGDGHPGITAVYTQDATYSYDPTSLNYAADFADKAYLVWRQELGFSGTLTSCTAAAGTATVTQFENHVVGCEDAATAPDKNCTSETSTFIAGPGFIDSHRTLFVPGTATFQATTNLPAAATCADVRAALP